MAMDMYDRLAHAAQAALAEKETSEDVRHRKIREAFSRAGYDDEMAALADYLSEAPEKAPKKGGKGG